jgi:hypothetical protein
LVLAQKTASLSSRCIDDALKKMLLCPPEESMIAPVKQPPSPSEESRVALKKKIPYLHKIRGWHPVI